MIDWNTIDTVLLDLDGTLLDLKFDNIFWFEFLPKQLAEKRDIPLSEATQHVQAMSDELYGTLEWYCVNHWGSALELDLILLKQELKHLIKLRPWVQEFLHRINEAGKQVVLVTNCHPDVLQFKLNCIPLQHHFEAIYDSHRYHAPKESEAFWQKFSQDLSFDNKRTVFFDDNENVLHSAKDFGIEHCIAIDQPDLSRPAKTNLKFNSINCFEELF